MPQHLHHHIKFHHLHYTEMNELYISLSLRAFSTGLVGIFVPIYLYLLDVPIVTIAGFFMLFYFAKSLMHILTAHLSARYGPKHILVVSYIVMFAYIMLLYNLPQQLELLWLAALVGGVADSLFWLSRHIDWATVAGKTKPTTQYSSLQIFSNIAMSMAPLIGGAVASTFGIGYTLLGAGAGLLLAAYPLVKTLEPVVPRKANVKPFRVAPWRHQVANAAMNFQTMVSIFFWPWFIFLIVKTYHGVGVIASASLLLLVITAWLLGRLGDKGKNSQVLKAGVGSRFMVHAARTAVQTFPAAMVVNVVGDITDMLTGTPYAMRFYEGARKYGIAAYLVDMEIAGDLTKGAAWAVLIILFLVFGLNMALIITFVLAALVMPFLRWIEPVPQPKAKVL